MPTTSTADIVARLAPPLEIERRCIALAMLDAILSPDWEYRYFSFNRKWDPPANTRMGSMRNGEGDDYFALFYPDGSAALKGFAHESSALAGRGQVSGVLAGFPATFEGFVDEPAFSIDTTTFCMWNTGDGWRRSDAVDPATIAVDGSADMLAMLVGTTDDYVRYAREYFEIDVSPAVVARFFKLEPLTPALVTELGADIEVDLDDLREDIEEIGYPVRNAPN